MVRQDDTNVEHQLNKRVLDAPAAQPPRTSDSQRRPKKARRNDQSKAAAQSISGELETRAMVLGDVGLAHLMIRRLVPPIVVVAIRVGDLVQLV